jgi:hypothetical protein
MDNFWVAVISAVIGAVIGAAGGTLATILQYKLSQQRIPDKNLFFAWRVAFDRAAFQYPFDYTSPLDLFLQVINDIILAVNTGAIRNAPGKAGGEGKTFIKDPKRRQKMDEVSELLHQLKGKVESALGSPGVVPKEQKTAMDTDRQEIIQILNPIWEDLKIPTLEIRPGFVQ